MKWGDLDSDDLTAPFVEIVKHCKNTRRQNIAFSWQYSVMQTLQLWQFGVFSELYGIFTLQGKRSLHTADETYLFLCRLAL